LDGYVFGGWRILCVRGFMIVSIVSEFVMLVIVVNLFVVMLWCSYVWLWCIVVGFDMIRNLFLLRWVMVMFEMVFGCLLFRFGGCMVGFGLICE